MNEKKLMLNAPQMTALSLVELAMHTLAGTANATKGLGADTLAVAAAKAIESLQAAHGAYIVETQRTVSIAAPGDVAKLVAAP